MAERAGTFNAGTVGLVQAPESRRRPKSVQRECTDATGIAASEKPERSSGMLK